MITRTSMVRTLWLLLFWMLLAVASGSFVPLRLNAAPEAAQRNIDDTGKSVRLWEFFAAHHS